VTDDGQITPRGYTNFNSYVENLHVLVFITDGQTEKLIRGGWVTTVLYAVLSISKTEILAILSKLSMYIVA
jgi:hypothetical protein